MNAVQTVIVVVAVVVLVVAAVYWYAKKNYNTQLSILEFFSNPIENIKGVFA
jgi:type II secretory pathway component PulK